MYFHLKYILSESNFCFCDSKWNNNFTKRGAQLRDFFNSKKLFLWEAQLDRWDKK